MELLFIVILSVLTLLLGYATYNLLRKNEALEDEIEFADKYLESTFTSMKNAYDRMKRVDRLGSFEADDESGYIFEEIKYTLEQLNETYNLDAEEEKE
jgi:hypothetical protein